MDYLGMLGFSCIILGGGMLIGLLAWLIHGWWIERAERKEHEADQRRDDEHYAGPRESLLQHIDELLKEVDK